MPDTICPQCGNPCDQAHKFCAVCGFPIGEVAKDPADAMLGTTLPGGYVILELVGVGGMGRVYRAEQKALGRTVAVKIIHPHLLGDESTAFRFINEARAASRLNHPNSVGVIDFGKNGGQLYLVMEFLRGRDLSRVLYEDDPLPFARTVNVLSQVLAALAEAHHLDIVHRDLKPENIILEPMRTGGDFVKVVDFGLAKMMAEVRATNITSPGIVCGTPDYMAPEQGRGEAIDARSDVYACGVVLFQMLTGQLPFDADSPTQVVMMHISARPPDPRAVVPERNIPDALAEVCLRALEKDAKDRYQSADDFAEALREGFVGREGGSGRFSLADHGTTCPSCQSFIPRGQRFCGECGARLADATKTASRRPSLGIERISSIPRLPLPFAGREDDIEWLDACRFEATSAGFGASLLEGEAGAGKTRLLGQFLRTAREVGDLVVEVGSDPWGADIGFWALRRAITGLAGLPLDGGSVDAWQHASAPARSGLCELFGKRERSGATRKHLWSRPQTARPSDDLRPNAAEALRWAMLRARERAGDKRLILAIEDLHAIDGASRHAFADVVATPPAAAIFVVGTRQTGREPGWESASTRLIDGLPTEVAASLLTGSTSTRTPPTEARTVLPLYIDQLLRFKLEGGDDPPPRLVDLVAQRIQRLSQDTRRWLQAVAVLGDVTEPSSVRALVPDVQKRDELVPALTAAGMIATEDGRLRVTHPLLREIVLATIPAGARRELHARAHDSEAVALLPLEVQALHAYHSQNAFEALMLLEQVADRASARGDDQGSVLALRRGLDLARREIFRGEIDDPVHAVLIFSRKLGEALARAGDLTDADGVLREALDLAGPSGTDRALVLGTLAYVSHCRDRSNEAAALIGEALQIARHASALDLVESLEGLRREWATG